ncbi:unnamed protein product [Pleuronectes platessa]|uniref:Uncharacterized protein n=1 Tax=Pleuronectes platessa TaxID=8262 RepID=A0A9N7VWD5_PLEPL|nr:unnamed protein product [Pleuronectes platessa]
MSVINLQTDPLSSPDALLKVTGIQFILSGADRPTSGSAELLSTVYAPVPPPHGADRLFTVQVVLRLFLLVAPFTHHALYHLPPATMHLLASVQVQIEHRGMLQLLPWIKPRHGENNARL